MGDLEDVDSDDDSIVLSVKQRWVAPNAWASWRQAARLAGRNAGIAAVLVGAGIGLSFPAMIHGSIPEPDRLLVVASGTPLVAATAWYVARLILQRLFFTRTALEMKRFIVPTLVQHAKWDELLRLARSGASAFIRESIIIRAVQRDAATYFVATEYDLTKGDWFGGAGYAGGG